MSDNEKETLIKNMVDNLPTLRKKLGVTQEGLAELAGISRSTLANIENRKRRMTWNNFLALLLIFIKNKETDKLLSVMEIYTDELNDFIKQNTTQIECAKEV